MKFFILCTMCFIVFIQAMQPKIDTAEIKGVTYYKDEYRECYQAENTDGKKIVAQYIFTGPLAGTIACEIITAPGHGFPVHFQWFYCLQEKYGKQESIGAI